MKKENIINLIKYHTQNNEIAFYDEVIKIINYFDRNGDGELAEYLSTIISGNYDFIPQDAESKDVFLKQIPLSDFTFLKLPDVLSQKVSGIVNAINHNVGINKFLFVGSPGTGKTEAAKQIAKALNRKLFLVNFESIVDSKLGQTNKNIIMLFREISKISKKEKVLILFDEIDILALDRINSNDLREMGRATSTILKELDNINYKKNDAIIIATTNLHVNLDKALIRRFDAMINFDEYTKEQLIEIGEIHLNEFLKKFKNLSKDTRLFRKIMNLSDNIPFPGELRNILRISIAFSDHDSEYDYLREIYKNLVSDSNINDFAFLSKNGFSLREIEKLTGKSKSSLSLKLNKIEDNYE